MSDITEEGGTARRLAKARQWIARQGLNGYLPRWEELTPDEQEQAETEARHWINAAVNAGISIVPAGRVVVDLPEPDGREVAGERRAARADARRRSSRSAPSGLWGCWWGCPP
jgi:predicted transcriptional regulator